MKLHPLVDAFRIKASWQMLPQQGEVSALSLEEMWMGADAPGLIHILAAAARNPLVHKMG